MNRQLNILYLSTDRGISLGAAKGAPVHIQEFLNAFGASGGSATLVIARKEAHSPSDRGFSIVVPKDDFAAPFMDVAGDLGLSGPALSATKDFCRNEGALGAVKTLFGASRFDLIYERYSLFGVAGFLAARKFKVPHVIEVNSPLVEEAGRYRELGDAELARSIEKTIFTSASHIICVSDEVRKYVIGIAPQARATVVANGVDTEKFAPGKYVKGGNMPKFKNVPVIGFAGAIKPWHGVNTLVGAFSIILKSEPKACLLLIGNPGNERENLVKKCAHIGIEESVHFSGPLAHEQVPSWLAEADILTAPYPQLDNFYFSPLKLYEYMAVGKPIIASRIGQIENTIFHEKNGLLTKPGDATELAGAILRLLKDKELAAELGAQARKDAIALHSWRLRMNDILAVFESTLSQSKVVEAGHASTL